MWVPRGRMCLNTCVERNQQRTASLQDGQSCLAVVVASPDPAAELPDLAPPLVIQVAGSLTVNAIGRTSNNSTQARGLITLVACATCV
eukprot:5975015-Alexandrium_andersonii.AAC.1